MVYQKWGGGQFDCLLLSDEYNIVQKARIRSFSDTD
jgi:hypothetical protein